MLNFLSVKQEGHTSKVITKKCVQGKKTKTKCRSKCDKINSLPSSIVLNNYF